MPPPPPLPRIVIDGAAPGLKTMIAGTIVVTAFALWIFPLFIAWVQRPGVQTSALIRCPKPVAPEQLHIVVVPRGESDFLAECMYVGSRGTYGTSRR